MAQIGNFYFKQDDHVLTSGCRILPGAATIPPIPQAPLHSAVRTRQSNSRLGIILMLSAMFLFSAADTMAKFLTSTYHPVQIIWFRQLGLLFGVIILLAMRGTSMLVSRQPKLQITRGVLAVFSSLLFVYAVRYVPLTDAIAASFVAPFFLTMAGAFILKEPVGIRRWSAVAVGFLGALIIIRPGMGVIHPAAMLVVVAASLYAARQVIGRLLADTDQTVTTIAYTAITASLVISIPLPFFFEMPVTLTAWALLFGMAVVAAVAEVMVIKALEVAEAATAAPIHYTLLIWGTFYGYFVFGQLPDQWTWIGTAIIVAAGLYTLRRGKAKH
jgi:drug/metabolite transporter (DMT)-like permease